MLFPLFLGGHVTQGEVSTQVIEGYRFVHKRDDVRGSVTVTDKKGRVVTKIVAELNVKAEKMTDLDGDGHAEVAIQTWTGGAHASFGYYILSLQPKPRCILAYWKGNGESVLKGQYGFPGDLETKDLDRDGKPELLSWSDGFAYRLGGGYAPVPIPLILKLRRGRFEEATASFPLYLKREAESSWNSLLETVKKRKGSGDLEIETRHRAVSYLIHKIILGQEKAAWSHLKPRMPRQEYSALYASRSWIRAVVNARKWRVRHPGLKQLPLNWENINDRFGPWD